MKTSGCKVDVPIMMNRFVAQAREKITAQLEETAPEKICFSISKITPTARLNAFETYRADIDFGRLVGFLTAKRQEARTIFMYARRCNVRSTAQGWRDRGIGRRASQMDQYLTVHAARKLYFDNTGSETQYMGDLSGLNARKTARRITTPAGKPRLRRVLRLGRAVSG